MWYPEPSKGIDGHIRDVHLGDVVYVDSQDGRFRRIFNITVDAQHELNKGGVPDGFTPLYLNPILQCSNEVALDPGSLCSEGVERLEVDGKAGV